MPTYEYQCRECGHAFEEYQSITADALVLCPNCGKRSLKRVMGGGGGLIFKGSGFYQTDYKKNGSSPSTSSTDKKKTGAASTEKKSGETKPPENKSTESKSTSSESKDTGSSKKSD